LFCIFLHEYKILYVICVCTCMYVCAWNVLYTLPNIYFANIIFYIYTYIRTYIYVYLPVAIKFIVKRSNLTKSYENNKVSMFILYFYIQFFYHFVYQRAMLHIIMYRFKEIHQNTKNLNFATYFSYRHATLSLICLIKIRSYKKMY